VEPLPFPNPEREWTRVADLGWLNRHEVVRRIGPTTAPLEVLPGGQANVNVRVGPDRVLRIYRRDRQARAREQALLGRRWESFVVPAVLDSGDDFLLLEHMAHGPLHASAEHGATVGRALAEIHQTTFETTGLLGSALTVCHPFGDLADAFRSHAHAELDRVTWLDASLRTAVDDLLATCADLLRREAESPVLLHGDFKASNLHWTPDARLLVLDWEFAYAGPALLDVGQLLRWRPPHEFVAAFAAAYREHGGVLSAGWERTADIFDLVNLAGLAVSGKEDQVRVRDIRRRLQQTLQL
jgi:fructosamine-3-kinase